MVYFDIRRSFLNTIRSPNLAALIQGAHAYFLHINKARRQGRNEGKKQPKQKAASLVTSNLKSSNIARTHSADANIRLW